MSLPGLFINATTLSLGAQRDRRHQAGNTGTKDRNVHSKAPEKHHAATEAEQISLLAILNILFCEQLGFLDF
jgi:hypothetical protein